MDVSAYFSGHGHVTPRRQGGKSRCKGPRYCCECAVDTALIGLKKHWKAHKTLAPDLLTAIVAVRVLGMQELRAEPKDDGTYSLRMIEGLSYPTLAEDHSRTFDIIEAMVRKGFGWQMTQTSGVAFTHNGGSRLGRGYRPGTTPMDVCLAALEALGIKL